MRKRDGVDVEVEEKRGLLHAIMFSCYKPFGKEATIDISED